ncbi:MAG TPA: 16S rRNA (cytosine(1402)-N(4))-methyltransferase RsmH [Candidatus Paceibacterota bacterium]|nr:16S rRNA (cytosine(1402)-N(4))-methyltransferase RsmH [Candidatus Paceibacterota bacterium]
MIQTLTSTRAQHHLRREEDGTLHERKSAPAYTTPREHTSVMLEQSVAQLNLKKGEMVVDATAGMGGHSEALLKAAPVTLLSLDADPVAVAATQKRLAPFGARAVVVEANFRDLEKVLRHQKIETIDKALFDLGWNMTQLQSGRGFSFMHDEPLLMSYGDTPASGFTAKEIVNTWEESVIADALYGYGEERHSRAIAKAIVGRREIQPIESTLELVEIVRDAVPASYRHGRINPATKTFQGLRIAVNDELGSIASGIAAAWKHLSVGGRIAVITFHSIEDRAVKRLFLELAKEGGKLITKKPLVASREEVARNAPSRSAKLRVIEKTN